MKKAYVSGAVALLLAAAVPNAVYAEGADNTAQDAKADGAAVNVDENSFGKEGVYSGNKDSFTYEDNHFLVSTQQLSASASSSGSQVCAATTGGCAIQGAGDVSFGSESMKAFAGTQNVAIETASGGVAQAQAATVVYGTVQLNGP